MLNTYEVLVDKFITYANSDSSIYAAIMFGSNARVYKPADEYSDIDFIMLVDYPELFLTTDAWLKNIGDYHISFIEDSIDGEKGRRVLFDDALNLDFLIVSKSNVKNILNNNDVVSFYKRGYKVLVDKDGLSKYIPQEDVYAVKLVPITEPEFINLENDFWFHTVWATKKLLRGELWAAKYCVDTYMKGLLLTLIESYAHVKNGMDYNTWHNGRFIDTWADTQVLNELRNAFSHYDKEDITRALAVTMRLFKWMSFEIAEKLGFEYPYAAERFATEWLQKMT